MSFDMEARAEVALARAEAQRAEWAAVLAYATGEQLELVALSFAEANGAVVAARKAVSEARAEHERVAGERDCDCALHTEMRQLAQRAYMTAYDQANDAWLAQRTVPPTP